MSFGKDSSLKFVMQDGKLVNLARANITADKLPLDSIEKEVWRIFGEHKRLQSENKKLREEIQTTAKWLAQQDSIAALKIAESLELALKGGK